LVSGVRHQITNDRAKFLKPSLSEGFADGSKNKCIKKGVQKKSAEDFNCFNGF
jgi:hypothetical protein